MVPFKLAGVQLTRSQIPKVCAGPVKSEIDVRGKSVLWSNKFDSQVVNKDKPASLLHGFDSEPLVHLCA